MRASVGCLTCFVALLGCSPVTEIVLEVRSPLAVPDELSAVRVEVDASRLGEGVSERVVRLHGADARALPVRVILVHEGGPLGPLDVAVLGERGDDVAVSQRLSLAFVPDRSVLVPVELSPACRDVTCSAGETCVDGACVSVAEPSDAGSDSADAGTVLVDAGPGASDAGPPACAPTLMCAGGMCRCDDGCACSLECAPGEECRGVHCDGDCTIDARGADLLDAHCHGATCTIDAREVSNVDKIKCTDGADCEVDCTDASNCDVRCESGSSCLVRCAGASNCEVRGCGELEDDDDDGDLRSCGGGVLACRRACP